MAQIFNLVVTATPGGWVLVLTLILLFLGWCFFASRANKRFRESVATTDQLKTYTTKTTDALLKSLPQALNEDLRKQVASLIEQKKKLEQARDWILIAVQLRGMKDPYWPERIPHASVLWNPQTGKYKAPEGRYRRFTAKLQRLDEVIGPAIMTEFGAPPYKKLNDNEFIMCDVLYKAYDDERGFNPDHE